MDLSGVRYRQNMLHSRVLNYCQCSTATSAEQILIFEYSPTISINLTVLFSNKSSYVFRQTRKFYRVIWATYWATSRFHKSYIWSMWALFSFSYCSFSVFCCFVSTICVWRFCFELYLSWIHNFTTIMEVSRMSIFCVCFCVTPTLIN